MALNFRNPLVQETNVSPDTLQPGQLAMTLHGLVGVAGEAMGVMGLTYSQPEIAYGTLEYETHTEIPTRLTIRLDK